MTSDAAGPRPTTPALVRPTTIRDVAEAAAVSQSTASRALSGNGYVAPAVRRRIQEAAARLRYVPDATAQHLRRRVSRTVGLVVSDLANPFYAELAAGAASRARERGYASMLTSPGVGEGGSDEPDPVRAFVELRVAGVLLTPSSPASGEFLGRHGVPIVEVDRQFAEGSADAVVVDNAEAAQRMTAGLLEFGHRRIALFIDETRWTTGRDRSAGYRRALEKAGVPADPALVVSSGWDLPAAVAAARRLLDEPRRPTAVFAANNVLAEGVWRAARALRLRIPDDLSVVSFDDAPWMSLVQPGVTVVAQDVAALGRTGIDVLLRRLADPSAPPQTVTVPYALVQRGSSGPPPDRP